MQNLPDLTQLSVEQKDELIRMLWPLQQQVQDLMAQMLVMQDRIKQGTRRATEPEQPQLQQATVQRRFAQTRTEVTAIVGQESQWRTTRAHWKHTAPECVRG